MASNTEISNMALSHLGIGKEIANLSTEKSAEASACRRFYSEALRATLEEFPWPFARKTAALNLITEDPNNDWAYSYRYPTDCVFPRRILSGSPNETRQARIPYYIGKDSQGRTILTNQSDAELEYTELVQDPAFYPSSFIMAFSYRLASLIAARVTQGDPFNMGEKMTAKFNVEISKAEANAVNEQQDFPEVESEFIRARE
jgi:hypothetical protein